MISLVLPLPPSANRYWRTPIINGLALTIPSSEARRYKKSVAAICLRAGVVHPMSGPVSVTARVFRARRAGDLMNFEKVLSDSLEGFVFENDSQIIEAHWYRHDDKHNPRVEIVIASCAA